MCLAGVAIGCLLHLTIRDIFPFPLSTTFYALPRPVLLMLSLIGCATAVTRRGCMLWSGVVLLLAGWVAMSDVTWNSPTYREGESHTIVFWNVGHDLTKDVAVVDGFLDHGPTIVGLVETGPVSQDWLAAWKARHPDYEFVMPHADCLIAVRGRIKGSGYHRLPSNSHAAWVDVELNGRTMRGVVVDIISSPWVSRREPLTKLSDDLRQWNDRPLVVMGDFNTPDDSVWLAEIRREFREAFRTAGKGYVPSWPWPAPVLKLDQIWVNRYVDVHAAWQTSTWHSDHRVQWGDISIKEINASVKRR